MNTNSIAETVSEPETTHCHENSIVTQHRLLLIDGSKRYHLRYSCPTESDQERTIINLNKVLETVKTKVNDTEATSEIGDERILAIYLVGLLSHGKEKQQEAIQVADYLQHAVPDLFAIIYEEDTVRFQGYCKSLAELLSLPSTEVITNLRDS